MPGSVLRVLTFVLGAGVPLVAAFTSHFIGEQAEWLRTMAVPLRSITFKGGDG